ncbi:Chromosome partitioning protein ParA [Ralstonia mannitolilytica]|jgi:chromosome partitioning protein|uniref:ParA family protein n=1 Tax=Burkholderiaceae TaxID=119060 RepID=UPI001B96947D|nr:ParA family protein [Burkholderia cenocepacia]MCS9883834.1 ParA family protein [Pseudomonas aeruginosa]MBR8373970.1 ParA family protein [Burkholderia cenocepacia]MBR8442871.1 ParA family protein [Burkholderia cenocepacia]MCT0160691.1 ParA family protein [Pseudomonas aeruginosa]MCT0174393.1 ParA family protein [Pseudomonas aeruginosa]
MRTIVVASQKGGVGKTTIAGHLGVMAEQSKEGPVALIDTDPQGSLASWWNERTNEAPLFARVEIGKLTEHLQALSKGGIKLAIIDTPPSVTEMIQQVLRTADLVLIPTRPSPHDLRAVGSTVELVENAGKRMIFVINGAAPRARIAGEAAVALSQHGTVAPVTLYQRTDFASSMIDGRTVQEIDPKGRSAEEIGQLWKYVSTQLRKI